MNAGKAAPLSLRRNFGWTFGSNLISGTCLWAMLAVLAKLVAPAKVGEYSYALAITAPIFLFAGLSLGQVQATDARRLNTFGEYLGLRLIMLAVSVIVTGIITAMIHPGRELLWVIVLVSASKVVDSLSDIMYGFQQQRERMDYIGISRSLQGVVQLALLGVVVWLTRSIVWGAAMIALGSALLTVFYDTRMTARVAAGQTQSAQQSGEPGFLFRPSWNGPRLWTLARLSLPLGFVAVFGMLNVNIPRYFVQHDSGLRELGIFSAMWSLLHPVGLITASIISSVMPRMARDYVAAIGRFKRMLFLLLALAGLSALLSVALARFFGRAILSMLFRPAYAEHPVAFQWMMAAAGMIYLTSVFTGAIGAARVYRAQPYIILGAMLSTTAACWLLVPHFGVLGATWAYGLGCTLWMLGFAIITWQAVRAAERRDAALKLTDAVLVTPPAVQV